MPPNLFQKKCMAIVFRLFERPDTSPERAQVNKLRAIITKADPGAG